MKPLDSGLSDVLLLSAFKELSAAQTKIAKLERAVSVLRYLHAHADLKTQARKSIQGALAELEME